MSQPFPRPTTPALALAAALLLVLGAAAVGYAALTIAATDPARPSLGIGTAVLLFGYGVLLLVLARAVYLGRRWSRGPTVAVALLLLPVAWSFAGGSTWWVALGLAAVAIAVLVCLLLRSSTAVFVPDDRAET